MTKHLIAAIHGPLSIRGLRGELHKAHDYLAEAAKRTARVFPDLSLASWGAKAKREPVRLGETRPMRITDSVTEHAFAEIVNQCATLERLIDALRWAETDASGLRDYSVRLCNPTTSSSDTDHDHDLVLEGPTGALAKFEVSDVASSKDGNGKEVKDLSSLGCLTPEGRDVPAWPQGRVFLVVSAEFAQRLRKATRHGLKRGTFHYVEGVVDGSDTSILEVLAGPAPVGASS